jgi:hypothetical protein
LKRATSDRKILPEGDDRRNFERLRVLGLARTLDWAHFLVLFVGWVIGTGACLYLLTRIIPKFMPTTLGIGFIVEGTLISGAIFAAGTALLYTNYTLTEFGKSLQRSALRFYPTRKRLREFRIASLVPGSFVAWSILAMVLACGMPLLLSLYLPGSETFRTIVLSAPPQAAPNTPSAAPPPASPQPSSGSTNTQDRGHRYVDRCLAQHIGADELYHRGHKPSRRFVVGFATADQ